ncbi:MAG TPA: hydroxyacid dehydrogenase [Chloroflexota bacterium]|nr:hydroxyacid dehydrogenase [Chloroflexota bacterium]
MSQASSTDRPKVALIVPSNRLGDTYTPEALAALEDFADVRRAEGDSKDIAAQLPKLLTEVDACLTSWGTPPITEEALDQAKLLRIVAHSAGSVKRLVPESIFQRGITVSHAASIIADAVVEMTVLSMLLGLRRVHEMDRLLKDGRSWQEAGAVTEGRLLSGQIVGLVGLGYVGRKVARLVGAFGPRILAYDPYLAEADARALGVERASLDDVFTRSSVVSIHAPVTPETHHLVGADQLRRLRDGAIFINCARSWVVDQEALLAELQTGRFWAALDVFDQEPLPIGSPFRALHNVVITPHKAGHSIDTHRRQGLVMIEELRRFFRGEDLQYRISPDAFARMA